MYGFVVKSSVPYVSVAGVSVAEVSVVSWYQLFDSGIGVAMIFVKAQALSQKKIRIMMRDEDLLNLEETIALFFNIETLTRRLRRRKVETCQS